MTLTPDWCPHCHQTYGHAEDCPARHNPECSTCDGDCARCTECQEREAEAQQAAREAAQKAAR